MKKLRAVREVKVERPRRAVVTEKEALKRMKEFSKRKEKFLATARSERTSRLHSRRVEDTHVAEVAGNHSARADGRSGIANG